MVNVYCGVPICTTNVISKEEKDKFYISYDSSYYAYGINTTALVIDRYKENKGDLFYILKGDHRKEYNLCKSLKECIKYFLSNKIVIHEYSDDLQLINDYI